MLGIDEWIEVEKTQSDWVMDALNDSAIDPTKEVNKPKIIFRIRETGAMTFEYRRVFTRGNFSAIIGKAKSKKTYLISAIAASIISGRLMWDKFEGKLDDGKNMVLYFDTEQGEWDAWNVVRRIVLMSGRSDRFKAFNLRRFTHKERCEIIEFAFKTYGKEAGLVVIDGIADLAAGINDEEEATRVQELLMRWTADYDCHICTVIHQNKGDGYATGHIGSSIMKKSEVIIEVVKDEKNYNQSDVNCRMIRGEREFKPFKLVINHEGMPEIDNVCIEINSDEFSKINDQTPF